MEKGFRYAVVITALITAVLAGPDDTRTPVLIGHGFQPAMAIGSDNTVHLVYSLGTVLYYCRGTLDGVFEGPEVIMAGTSLWDARIVLDKNNDPHVAVADGHYLNNYTFYTNRVGGSWKRKLTVFSKTADDYNRATTPHLVVADDLTVYVSCFTVGNADGTTEQWGAVARLTNVGTAPAVAAKARVDNWNPQLFLKDGKLMVGGRNKASGSRDFTFAEHSTSTLARTGSLKKFTKLVHGEMARSCQDADGDLHAAGTINGASYTNAGWYNSLSRVNAGKGPIRYRTTRVNPCGSGMPVKDRVAADRVYVVYWSTEETETEEPKTCEAAAQVRYMRVENGQKANEMMPVTSSPTGGHGPSYRVTPCAVAHPRGGMCVVISGCDGKLYYTTVGNSEQLTGMERTVLPVMYPSAMTADEALLFDAAGRQVRMEHAPAGIYFISNGSEGFLRKIMISGKGN